jgi:enoyl-[acyl-carrier protein] reductase III
VTGPDLAGRTALVTGGSRGLGLAIARKLCASGVDVLINYAGSDEDAEKAVASLTGLRGAARAVKADVTDPAALDSMLAQIHSLDIFVHNCSRLTPMSALATDPGVVDESLAIALRPLLAGAARLAELMADRPGRIIAVPSSGAHKAVSGYVAAGVAKAAMESAVRYLAAELAGRGIAVNAVSTSKIDKGDRTVRPEQIKALAARTPAGRLTTPDDVAGVVALLCADEAAWIHGQVITADGGLGIV